MKRLLLATLGLILWSSAARAFVVPDLSFDNMFPTDKPIGIPLLYDGLLGVELGRESGDFDCRCAETSGDFQFGFNLGLSRDKAFNRHGAYRLGLRVGQKPLNYRDGEDDIAVWLTVARVQASIGLMGSPWDYCTLILSVGGFGSVIVDVDGEANGKRRSEYGQNKYFSKGEAGITAGLQALFSPGRGRKWLWSIALWYDFGLSHIGRGRGFEPIDPDEPITTGAFTATIGVHF